MPSIQSIIFATAVILDSMADRDAVMALSAMTASASRASGSPRRSADCCREGWYERALVEHSDFSDYRLSSGHQRRNMKRATLNTEEMT